MKPLKVLGTLARLLNLSNATDSTEKGSDLHARLFSIEQGLIDVKNAVEKSHPNFGSGYDSDFRYLGGGVGIARLQDNSNILLNSRDSGPALSVIVGHKYEEGSVNLLLSFLEPNSVFIDVGANVGVFAIQVAKRLTSGKVFAFEPQVELFKLIRISAYINGINSNVEAGGKLAAFCLAASDATGSAEFVVPEGHAGGGRIGCPDAGYASDINQISTRVVTTALLDDIFGQTFTCDLVKMDVEGHELEVLRGMKNIIARSPRIKILLEHSGRPDRALEMEEFFADAGFSLWTFDAALKLSPADLRSGKEGNLLAIKIEDVIDSLERNKFSIFPGQLIPGPTAIQNPNRICGKFKANETISYGPYWHLQSGSYRLCVRGKWETDIHCSITSHAGVHVLAQKIMSSPDSSINFGSNVPLPGFEIVFRAISDGTEIEIHECEIARC